MFFDRRAYRNDRLSSFRYELRSTQRAYKSAVAEPVEATDIVKENF
ncbi:hypothetical protein [Melioribacter sp. OK-6-Me]